MRRWTGFGWITSRVRRSPTLHRRPTEHAPAAGRLGSRSGGEGRKCRGRRQGRAGQGRAGQGRAGQGRAGQGRAGQGRAGQAGGRRRGANGRSERATEERAGGRKQRGHTPMRKSGSNWLGSLASRTGAHCPVSQRTLHPMRSAKVGTSLSGNKPKREKKVDASPQKITAAACLCVRRKDTERETAKETEQPTRRRRGGQPGLPPPTLALVHQPTCGQCHE
jgi:hypothetical protein